jgi:SAM-dependent methyltransferase
MMSGFTFFRGLRSWWREGVARYGLRRAARKFFAETWDFLRDSTPGRRRQRFGDIEFDLDHRVNTTSAGVPLRTRLRGLVSSPYQPTEPALFHEIMQALKLNWAEFTFVDLGSGKGRTLLMAADYPFGRIVGVELLPELHAVALENIRKCAARCEAICGDARDFVFPPEPTVLYLFNPLPEPGLAKVIANLEHSLQAAPRAVYVAYHNPEHEHLLAQSAAWKKIAATASFVVYESVATGN